MRVCLIVPALNEAARIASVVEGGAEHVETVYVVDDGSTDGTAEAARAAGATVIRLETNMGKGVAIRAGVEAANSGGHDVAITIDGDGQHDPADIPRFIERQRATGAHVVLGTRMNDVGSMPVHRRWNNRLVSAVGQWLGHSVAPDFQCGYRLMLLAPLRGLGLETRGYETEAELLLRLGRAGYVIDSVPVATVYAGEASSVRPLREMLRFTRLLFRSLDDPQRRRAPGRCEAHTATAKDPDVLPD